MTVERPTRADLAIDTSALIAIARREEHALVCQEALLSAAGPIISAGTMLELEMVAGSRLGPGGLESLKEMLDTARCAVVPVDPAIIAAALAGWRTFGKGNHPARLNFGDCFAYATAKHWDVPLLCVGDDFALTDIEVVPTPTGVAT